MNPFPSAPVKSAGQATVYSIPELDPATALVNGKTRSQSALRTEHSMMVFLASQPAAPIHGEHNHPHDQMIVVLKGAMIVTIEGVEHEVRAGSAIVIPALAFHTAWAIGNEACSRIEMFAPVRQDFVPLTAHQTETFATPAVPWFREGATTWTDKPADK